jgi:hypothetical protein
VNFKDEEYDIGLMAIDGEEIEDLAMLATDEALTTDKEDSCLMPNPLKLLIEGIEEKNQNPILDWTYTI